MIKSVHTHSGLIGMNDLLAIQNQRIQHEAMVARDLLAQNPSMKRPEALRAAAAIVERDYARGYAPA